MRRIHIFLICILLLLSMLGLLFFSGAIYDAEKKSTIDTFFFEPNLHSAQRITPPVSADDIPDKLLREFIIARFVHEYFYVIPDETNARNRAGFKNTDGTPSTLWGLSQLNPKILTNWANTVAPQIIELAGKKALRSVQTLPDITEDKSGHLVVKYILRTWDNPNDVLATPKTESGVLY